MVLFRIHSPASKMLYLLLMFKNAAPLKSLKIKTKNKEESAVGFTCFMDTVLRASSFENNSKKILVPFDINDKIKKSLINENYVVLTFFGDISDIPKYSKKYFCTHIYINNRIKKI